MSCRFVDQDWAFVDELKNRDSSQGTRNVNTAIRLSEPRFHSLGPRLRYILRISRLRSAMSINELARCTGISRDELIAIEEGKEYPSQDLIKLLERQLSVELVKKSPH